MTIATKEVTLDHDEGPRRRRSTHKAIIGVCTAGGMATPPISSVRDEAAMIEMMTGERQRDLGNFQVGRARGSW